MQRQLVQGSLYCHFKNKLYQVKGIAYHSETKEPMVVYQALYGTYDTYVRPLDMFLSPVDHEKYPGVQQKYRFTRVEIDEREHRSYPEEDAGFLGPQWPVTGKPQESAASDVKEALEEAADVSGIHPLLMEFLDTDDFEKKYNILVSLREDITDQMIDTMAVTIDTVIPEGELSRRYDDLKQVIRTRQQYEFANRLR